MNFIYVLIFTIVMDGRVVELPTMYTGPSAANLIPNYSRVTTKVAPIEFDSNDSCVAIARAEVKQLANRFDSRYTLNALCLPYDDRTKNLIKKLEDIETRIEKGSK